MAYGLPIEGELNWDVKLNASIEAVKATADAAAEEQATGRLSKDALNAAFARRDSTPINVRDFGAIGDGVADDTAALQAALNAAHDPDKSRTVFIPEGTYLVSATLTWLNGASIAGDGTSTGGVPDLSSRIKAAPGFTGTDILRYVAADQAGQGAGSWHWGTIERIAIEGNGTTGPRGLHPGNMGENSSIRDVQIVNCSTGFYFNGEQASAHLENLAAHGCGIGLHFDGLQSTARLLGVSGDNNTNLIRYKGGLSANLTVVGMKAENYTAGTGDPVVLIEDLDGGSAVFLGGWADANAARTDVIRIDKTTAANNAMVTVVGLGGNTAHYTNLVRETFAGGRVIGINPNGVVRPNVFLNAPTIVGNPLLENGTALRWRNTAGTYQALLVGLTDNTTELRALGSGGGALAATGGGTRALRWSSDGTALGFFGTAPVAKPAATAELKGALAALGLITDGGATPLDLDGGALTCGLATVADLTATGTVRLGDAATDTLGFFGAAPVARPGTYNLTGAAVDRTLAAYASNPENAAYPGNPATLTDAARNADLEALRVAYENLRTYVEDLAGIVAGTVTDLKALGLLG